MTPEERDEYDKRFNIHTMLCRWQEASQCAPLLTAPVERCMVFKPQQKTGPRELLY